MWVANRQNPVINSSPGVLRLTADGRIKPCLHGQAEYPLKGLDEDGMKRQFEAAILAKPPWHGELSEAAPSQAGRPMHRIGG